ncbi:response regulator [Paenibacillus sp.]|jgi:two-component system response regulator YesN|uniref:response regulator transcription factor n=1 Tax=Paenibacillus sp. TaxID=58172 RepID=UPI0028358FAF|nr:helix-turn-helix domain-containing protein [Paenibacillus sp.]MDR0271533.1 response regulator [Paenibacillus sp.]
MYKALIVDDEIYAVMGIRSGVKWQELQISEVYEAYNMREALQVFERTPIDVMICDIEMPKGTGIELLERVNEISPETETIFLTAHSDFDFMKRAIQLDGFDYLLKPIEFDVLQDTIAKALGSIKQERELHNLREQYKPYYETWRKKKSLITDKFWNDLLSGRVVCSPNNIVAILEEHELPELQHAVFQPVLVSVESWLREFSTKDEEIMEYAIRKGASEMLLPSGKGEVIQTKQDVNVVIAFGEDRQTDDDLDIHARCEKYIRSCHHYFGCNLSCYIGKSSSIYEIADTYGQLLEMEYNNLNKSNQVYTLAAQGTQPIKMMIPRISTWTVLLEQGKLTELQQEIRTRIAEMGKMPGLSLNKLEGFRHEFMQMVHYILHKNGLSAFELFQDQEGLLLSAQPRNLQQLETLSLQLAQIIYNQLHQNDSVIQRVKYYITENLSEQITREQLASYVHLNPAYLSRLFKREVGESITDYILHVRMSLAKDLITTTSIPISDVAQTFGYHNFSHFSKMFRKVYQVSPQQFRQQSVESK